MKEEPKITVITSLYKAGGFLEDFLEDIQKQTIFSDIDWYFIDAASPDKEFERLIEFQKDFRNVRVRRMRERIGIYPAWNIGIKKARADLISNLNVDDRVTHDYYEFMVNKMEKYKEVDVMYTDVLYCKTQEYLADSPIMKTPRFCDLYTIAFFGAPHNCPVWRKSLHEDVGLFDESLISSGDKEFWMRANILGKKFKKINKPLSYYYLNPEGISTKGHGFKSEASRTEDERILKHYEKELVAHGI